MSGFRLVCATALLIGACGANERALQPDPDGSVADGATGDGPADAPLPDAQTCPGVVLEGYCGVVLGQFKVSASAAESTCQDFGLGWELCPHSLLMCGKSSPLVTYLRNECCANGCGCPDRVRTISSTGASQDRGCASATCAIAAGSCLPAPMCCKEWPQ